MFFTTLATIGLVAIIASATFGVVLMWCARSPLRFAAATILSVYLSIMIWADPDDTFRAFLQNEKLDWTDAMRPLCMGMLMILFSIHLNPRFKRR